MTEAKELLSKFSKIALDDDKMRAVEIAMNFLSEDAGAIQQIKAAQNKRTKISNEPSKRYKENSKARKPPAQEVTKVKPRLSVAERARLVYGCTKPAPITDKPARQFLRQPKIASIDNLVNKYMAMGASDICNPEITEEMRSLKLM